MEENENKFEVISSKVSNANFKKNKGNGFGKTILLPFVSGVVGCSVVIGTCFGVPSIRNSILGTETNNFSNNSKV